MPKHTSRASRATSASVKVAIITLDSHLAGTLNRVHPDLSRECPGLEVSLHAASEWGSDPEKLAAARDAIADADILLVTMLFMEDHIKAVRADIEARRNDCDALVVCMSEGEVTRLTRVGRFAMAEKSTGMMALLKKLRGSRKPSESSGAKQMAMLRRLPRMLRFIPGTAQDVRAYFLTMQFWLSCSDENFRNMIRLLVSRYARNCPPALKNAKIEAPVEYPDVGVFHPSLPNRVSERAQDLPKVPRKYKGTVGVLVMRSYVLAGDTAHYEAVISALQAKGLRVIPAFASGLDARPVVESYFLDGDGPDAKPCVDAVLSLTGFSLVGGPAYNDAKAAEDMLARLDVPYLAAHALEFQSIEQWQASERGLMPVETTMMVAIPELDGSTGPTVFGGRTGASEGQPSRDMKPAPERINALAARIDKLVTLRKTAKADRKLSIVLYNFPPNGGATGTAAFLSVFRSLFNTLHALKAEGYDVGTLPDNVDGLRASVLSGNAERFGTDANVHITIPTDDYVRAETHLEEIEAQWGPAPGRHQSDGRSLLVLGKQFGKVLVAVQPAFGYEGDPMRLLFERGFTPTHAFAAFYRYLRDTYASHAVLHFGTHGALEFMPGKQVGMSDACWPDRLIGDLPNIYLYAANNPSEGTIAKRRSAATLVSYLTPSIAQAGLYRGLVDLKASIDRWRTTSPDQKEDREQLAVLIKDQAAEVDLIDTASADAWSGTDDDMLKLSTDLYELENALIPSGLHVIGEPMNEQARSELVTAIMDAQDQPGGSDAAQQPSATATATAEETEAARLNALLAEDHETPALMRALDGRFVRPAPGGDLLKSPAILPTGRNVHGFDPYRMPSAFAMRDGKAHADLLIERHQADTGSIPESVALVLWGTDNLKSEGTPIAQALALMGATPRFDGYGRLSGADLIPLEELGRPRIDVVVTLSGIFRDLLPLQTRMLAEAAYQAATADEPAHLNFIRRNALAFMNVNDCDMETAALRVFSNADGTYGSNVNQLIDSGAWTDEDELAETYTRRKCFAYGKSGQPVPQPELLNTILGGVDLAYQNLESVELGITTIDHYFDTLGGIGKSIERAKGDKVPVYIGDQTRGEGKVRTLSEQVALETRTRALNPKWYESMLEHGYEGVRQIEAHVTNTMGWSATTGQVQPWVYEQLTETFVLDDAMRERLAELNPKASAKMANRLLEAHERDYWTPDEDMLAALQQAEEELEDRLEGIATPAAAGAAA